jgi:hypothetical protein
MAEADNSSSEAPPLSQRQAEHNFNEAARHCYAIIQKGESPAVDEIRWAYQIRCWSEIARPELDAAFAQCERAGIQADTLRTRIEKLDTRYRLVCEFRDGIPAKSATPAVDPFKTGAPGRPTVAHLVIAEAKRRIESGEAVLRKDGFTKFAEDLVAWNEEERKREPRRPAMKTGSIKNSTRKLWNRALSGAQN